MEILRQPRKPLPRRGSGVPALALAFATIMPFGASAQTAPPRDLTQISLEDLMNVEVVSVARKEQKLSKTAAAVFVIAREDIERSGAANIPDLLRMAPGVNVARVNANSWAISIRGFNSRYSNKILVLVDGRSVSSPYFSGVNWDQLDVPLEDIERIEVIRGPGGTAWGTNAMNGVINIITKSSKSTPGALAVARAGSQESGGLTQYGGKAGSVGTWRAFAKYANTEKSLSSAGGPAADGWHSFHEGFRADLEPSARDKVMVQGDIYRTGEGQTLTKVLSDHLPAVATYNDPLSVASGDLQMRWDHQLKNGSVTSLNAYYDRVRRLDQGLVRDSSLNVDFQQHLAPKRRNDVVWGLGYRVTFDNIRSSPDTRWNPAKRTDNLWSGFIQDEIQLAGSMTLTVGSKLEHNSYTGFEFEPSAQLVWTPTTKQTVWISASRAIRQPARQDADVQYDYSIIPLGGTVFGVVTFFGSPHIQAEQVRDYEGGYRTQINKRLSLDVSFYRSYFSHIETTLPGVPQFVTVPSPPHFIYAAQLRDNARVHTYGGEVFATWNVTNRWRVHPGFSFTRMNVLHDPLDPLFPFTAAATFPGTTPKHQIQFRSEFALRPNVDWDASCYFVGRLDGSLNVPAVARYTRLDTQLRWRILEALEIGIVGQNLLTPRHAEFAEGYGINPTQVRRSILGKVTWRF